MYVLYSPPDDLGILVVGAEEVVIAISLGGLTSIFANVEDASLDANPVHVASQLLRDVRLATGGQAHHGDHMRNVDIGRGTVA